MCFPLGLGSQSGALGIKIKSKSVIKIPNIKEMIQILCHPQALLIQESEVWAAMAPSNPSAVVNPDKVAKCFLWNQTVHKYITPTKPKADENPIRNRLTPKQAKVCVGNIGNKQLNVKITLAGKNNFRLPQVSNKGPTINCIGEYINKYIPTAIAT